MHSSEGAMSIACDWPCAALRLEEAGAPKEQSRTVGISFALWRHQVLNTGNINPEDLGSCHSQALAS